MSQKILRTRTSRQRGFTLVEMLVVAALIAIFAGLAVFNITAQLEREKSKAAVAEARNIATAMSFAYDDLGWFPKIGLLKYNVDNLFDFLKGTGFDSAEYHSYNVAQQDVKLRSKWRQNYMAGSGPDKTVKMCFNSNGNEMDLDWPADPWGNPYVAYFLKTVPGSGSNGAPTQKFIQSAGDKANYAASIVSYGRNKRPGLFDNPQQGAIDQTQGWRLYTEYPAKGPRYYWDCQGDASSNSPANGFNSIPERVNAYVGATNPLPVNSANNLQEPLIRMRGSDDRFYEF